MRLASSDARHVRPMVWQHVAQHEGHHRLAGQVRIERARDHTSHCEITPRAGLSPRPLHAPSRPRFSRGAACVHRRNMCCMGCHGMARLGWARRAAVVCGKCAGRLRERVETREWGFGWERDRMACTRRNQLSATILGIDGACVATVSASAWLGSRRMRETRRIAVPRHSDLVAIGCTQSVDSAQ